MIAARRDRFLSVSVAVTGCSRVQLEGTGAAAAYLDQLEAVLGERVEEFLAAAPADDADPSTDPLAALMTDPVWGPVVHSVMILWYTGSWTALPDSWRAANGAADADETHVLSPESYRAGLQWVVAGAHPPGANQLGFGSWSVGPASVPA